MRGGRAGRGLCVKEWRYESNLGESGRRPGFRDVEDRIR